MRFHKIPEETVRRLPIYLRGLVQLTKQGQINVSSSNLAEMLQVNPPQIRKDLSYFGDFGTPGVGYKIPNLLRQVRNILKLNCSYKTVLVGFGNLGLALFRYSGFHTYGFEIAAIFDDNPEKIGIISDRIEVEDVTNLDRLKDTDIRIGIITVPAESAQDTADKLIRAGITGILNFAPAPLRVPKKIKVVTIDIGIELAQLPYYLPAN